LARHARAGTVIAGVLLLVVLMGASAVAAGNGADTYTGCLNPGGQLSKVDEGTSPTQPCTGNELEVQLAGAAAVEALQAQVEDLTGRTDTLEETVASLQAELPGLDDRLAALETTAAAEFTALREIVGMNGVTIADLNEIVGMNGIAIADLDEIVGMNGITIAELSEIVGMNGIYISDLWDTLAIIAPNNVIAPSN